MKDLTPEEAASAPQIIQDLIFSTIADIPVSFDRLGKAIHEHPEYFPDVLEYRRKWSVIPEWVHSAYNEERKQLHDEVFKDLPPSKGIIGWVTEDPDGSGYKAWTEAYNKCKKAYEPLAKELHRKYYKKYGIEYSGW